MVVSKEPYKPPPEFQELKEEPLVEDALSDTTELWLIQMPLNQFEPADLRGKQISLKLPEGEGWMGCVENSHGKSYDMYCLGNQGTEPVAFLPRSKTSLAVRRIARHICLLKTNTESEDVSGRTDHSVGNSGSTSQSSVKREGMSRDQGRRSAGSVSQKSSQVVSGITSEGREHSIKVVGKSPRTPTASYSRNLEESGAYDSSVKNSHRGGTNEVSEEPSSERKKKKRKANSGV